MPKTQKAFVIPSGVDGKQLTQLKEKLLKGQLLTIKEQTGKGDFSGILPLLARTDRTEAGVAEAAPKIPQTREKAESGTVERPAPAAQHSMERPPDLPKSWRKWEPRDESFSALFNIKDLYLEGALPPSLIEKFAKELKSQGVLSLEHIEKFEASI